MERRNNTKNLRNIAIIAHVDHGKTTLVDQLLRQSGSIDNKNANIERVMDSNDIEKERGITILSKNASIKWKDFHINIVDTPGHADFGGEVERVLAMVDSVLLLVDAVEGPMPQTRFVTKKAFAAKLNPIVIVNKVDRDGARNDEVLSEVFDLFDNLGANDTQLDFPIVYTSGILGKSGFSPEALEDNMNALFETIIKHVPSPDCDPNGPFQMQVSSLDYSNYVGSIAIGRIKRGSINSNSAVKVINCEDKVRDERVLQIFGYEGLGKVEKISASAGDIVAVTGVSKPRISDTLCQPEHVEKLPALSVDEPTVQMIFQVNDSPFAGQEGKFVTSRQIKERLDKELLHNVALRVEQTDDPDKFIICGRGELHLAILIENLRREGYELAVSKASVIYKIIDGQKQEPFENLAVDVEENHQGPVMEFLSSRKGDLQDMSPDGTGRVRLNYLIPAKSLIGFRQWFLTTTQGSGLATHVFSHYGLVKPQELKGRPNGVLIAKSPGKATAYSLWNLQARGKMFITPQTEVYEGMIIGINSRGEDLVVNVTKGKQLTNVRASGSDENINLTPPETMTLEKLLDFINDDELVEITPENLRLRKKIREEGLRKRPKRG
ncbi:MAG: translational GTPase TypA [Zetaproteobacteria bacterium]|nr:translational GTPase TypA [Pseudobdellovibrionaceae bacterium]